MVPETKPLLELESIHACNKMNRYKTPLTSVSRHRQVGSRVSWSPQVVRNYIRRYRDYLGDVDLNILKLLNLPEDVDLATAEAHLSCFAFAEYRNVSKGLLKILLSPG